MSFQKNAVLIGASGGIGSELVKALKADGYHIISVARTGEYACDLTDYQQIDSVITKIKNDVKQIDLLVHAAGVATYKNLPSVTNNDIQSAFMVNMIAPAIFTRELAPIMQKSDSLVLSLGSGAGNIPMRGRSIYCATKYALRGFSLSLSEEYKDMSPSFCLITLGSTLTDFGPLPLAEKQKQADAGKAYFPVSWVINKLIEIIHDQNRESEIVLFPGQHGFGEWKKP